MSSPRGLVRCLERWRSVPPWRRSGLVAVATALAATGALGQGIQSGEILGTVRDAAGDVVVGIAVDATSPALQGRRTGVTDTNGAYLLRDLPPGTYRVQFESQGAAALVASADVELGRATRLDVTLPALEVVDVLEVEAETERRSSLLETLGVGANFTRDQVDLLPIGRTLSEVSELAPGVNDNAANANLSQIVISGGFAYDNNVLVDGVDVIDNVFAIANDTIAGREPLFIEEAIEETQVLTTAISAEYGRFTGGVVNAITKSGGNELSGSLRIDLSNPSWRGETPIEEARGVSREDELNRVVSGTLGGAIQRDRLWYLFAFRDSDQADPTLFPVTRAPRPRDSENRIFELKLTAQPNPSHSFKAAVTDGDTDLVATALDLAIDPAAVDRISVPSTLAVLRWGGIVGDRLYAEARVSSKDYEIEGLGAASLTPPQSPIITFTQELAQYNAPYFDSTDPQERNNQELAASLSGFFGTEKLGSHDVKIGIEHFDTEFVGGNSQSPNDLVFQADYLTTIEGDPFLDANGRLQPVFAPFGALLLNFLPLRGATMDVVTQTLYARDRWLLDEHWSFDLGFRYERIETDASDGLNELDTDVVVPRLSVAYDPKGDGRFKLGASYAEYVGRHTISVLRNFSNVANPDALILLYVGPPGAGVDFAPGFDLASYVPILGLFPAANIFADDSLEPPRSREITLSGGLQLGGGRGALELVLTDRQLEDVIEDFVTIDNGTTVFESPLGPLLLDRVEVRNSDVPVREYRAAQLVGRYRISDRWEVQGHWTHQFENDGNYEGETPNRPGILSALGDYPEILAPERNEPRGRLTQFQRDRIRVWTNYGLELGDIGRLDLGLLYRYDSPRRFSLAAENAPVSPLQLARDPGYAQPPVTQTIYFGSRGAGEFDAAHLFDLSAHFSFAAGGRVEPWIRLEIRNLLDDDTRIAWDTTVFPDIFGPVDENGIWTQFVPGPLFGQARSPEDFATPRELLVSLGLRF